MGVATLAGLTLTLALLSGQWAAGSGQRATAVTRTALLAGVTRAAVTATAVTLTAPQIKLGEEPADREKEKAAAVARARTYLGKKLGVAPEKLVLDSAKPATWPDASLGCPEQDRMYAQVLTDGYKVLLKHDGKTHEVHVAGSRAVSCEPRR